MKYTRVEIKDKFKKYKYIALFIVVIPILALITGKAFISYSENKETLLSGSDNVSKGNIYFIQLGVYAKEDGAKVKVNSLREHGIESIILNQDDKYKVISGLSANKESLEKNKTLIEQKGINVYIKEFTLKDPNEIKDENTKKYCTEVNRYILSALNGKYSNMKKNYKDALNIKEISKENKENQTNINKFMKEYLESLSEKMQDKSLAILVKIINNYNKIV